MSNRTLDVIVSGILSFGLGAAFTVAFPNDIVTIYAVLCILTVLYLIGSSLKNKQKNW